jgi:ArsR family transcriptional regulator
VKSIPLKEVVGLYRAMADPTRMRLLHLIYSASEVRVGELTAALQLPQSTVSRQLGQLRGSGLILDRRDGTSVWYSLNPGSLSAAIGLLEGLRAAGRLSAELRSDLRRLGRMRSAAG